MQHSYKGFPTCFSRFRNYGGKAADWVQMFGSRKCDAKSINRNAVVAGVSDWVDKMMEIAVEIDCPERSVTISALYR